jgi:hypothetical protein
MVKISPEPDVSEVIITAPPEVVSKATLKISHKYDDLRTKLQRDMRKWQATLAEGNQDEAKILALKKTLLLLGSSGMEITGGVEKETISASKNKLPIAEYLSGHMGRVYLGLPEKGAAETLKWISGEDKVIKPRFAATHAGKVDSSGDKKEVKEKKLGFFQAAFSGIASIVNSTFSSTPRIHNGMDVAMGGKGNILESAQSENPEVGKIKDDGTCGHVYFNANSGKNGDSLGIGLEGTAPGKTGYLGSHSITGSADEFSALEGEKFAVKFNKKALASYGKETDSPKVKEAVQKLKDHFDYKGSFFKRLGSFFNGKALLSKDDLAKTCEAAGVVLVGGGKQMLTRFGKQCVEAGIKPQDNYGGAKMMVKQETLDEVKRISDSEIPDEIIYFKPQNSPQCFIAQKPIYEGIGGTDLDPKFKSVLRDNPQFSHETSVAIGTFYNSANSRSSSDDDGAKIIRETIGLINKDKLGILGIDINSFDVLKDFEKLKSSLNSSSPKGLNDLGITVEKDALMASLEKMKMVATAIAEAKEGEFSTEKKYLELEDKAFGTKRADSYPDPEMVVNKKAFNPLQNHEMVVDEETSKESSEQKQTIQARTWASRIGFGFGRIVGSSRVHPEPEVIKSESHSR